MNKQAFAVCSFFSTFVTNSQHCTDIAGLTEQGFLFGRRRTASPEHFRKY
jgi:hypothetical protein